MVSGQGGEVPVEEVEEVEEEEVEEEEEVDVVPGDRRAAGPLLDYR